MRLLDLARRAAAQVLGVGERAQQALLGRRQLGLELASRAVRSSCASAPGGAGVGLLGRGLARRAVLLDGGRHRFRFEVLGSLGLIHRLNSWSELPRRRETTRAV